jgi:hypothetical protein
VVDRIAMCIATCLINLLTMMSILAIATNSTIRDAVTIFRTYFCIFRLPAEDYPASWYSWLFLVDWEVESCCWKSNIRGDWIEKSAEYKPI